MRYRFFIFLLLLIVASVVNYNSDHIFQDTLDIADIASGEVLPGASEYSHVVRVIDGDTVELVSGETVRYIGIDTPETSHPRTGVECFGQQAKEYNRGLIEGKRVRLERDVSDTDRYGRLLRYVWIVEGDEEYMVNYDLVARGYAVAATYPPDVSYQDEFRKAETVANKEDLGLWGTCDLN